MTVGLVVVSHSAKLAEGVVEVAGQMAKDVRFAAAGGTDDGGIGTSLDKVMTGIEAVQTGAGVLVVCDLGSAVMTAESALEFLGNPDDVRVADAPLVEGTVAAAVAAQSGRGLAQVCTAAEQSLAGHGSASAPADSSSAPANTESVTADVELINPLGLHARPAATLAGGLGKLDVDVTINGMDGQSVMMLMALGAGKGTVLHVVATGADAEKAVGFVTQEVSAGFGEL
ncbi:MAG: PTS-dependent dihydroxyacetone kinase phosphotransferase subunit DhaM [Acidobacteria bacterium]|nr:PTS-dependent dihydroxyacetone kinase phosphotransferase subunit DhaM [Acidobacteriota bacterium]